MIQHVWSILCQSASIDVQTNNVSLFNVMENIVVPSQPSPEKPLVLSCEIISLWAREKIDEPANGQLQVNFVNPDGRDSQSIILDIDLTKSPLHRTRLTIGALPITTTGRFEFRIDYRLMGEENWLTVARLPLFLSSQQPEKVVNNSTVD